MILSCQNLSKSYNEYNLFANASFHIEANDKVALVGDNGTGKTTLLKMILGDIQPDIGNISISKNISIGYLAQNANSNSTRTIIDESMYHCRNMLAMEDKLRDLEISMKTHSGSDLKQIMKLYSDTTHTYEINGGYEFRSRIKGILKGLGFNESDYDRQVNTLSGGERTRFALAAVLIDRPDLIMLDEPTNHLDMDNINWLEGFLSNYNKAVLVVSHDRYFLDKISNKILDLYDNTFQLYNGSYSNYISKKRERINSMVKAYNNNQAEITRQEAVISKLRSFNREKSIKRAQSREKLLEKIEIIERPLTETEAISISFNQASISGNDVLTINNLHKSYGSNLLFENFNLDMKRGERIAIIGSNGTGKSTLLKILNNTIDDYQGKYNFGTNVIMCYFDQEHNLLNPNNTLLEEVSDHFPNLNNTEIRNTLASINFKNDDVFKKISDLSGGERGRLMLAKIMLHKSNFLILDEPTNHLDVKSKEVLEEAMNRYEGSILYVSHDRYFVNKTATSILELKNGSFTKYIGNYDYYAEKSFQKEYDIESLKGNSISISSQKNSWQANKEASSISRKHSKELERIEKRIIDIEAEITNIEQQMFLEENCSNAFILSELSISKNSLEDELYECYEKFEELENNRP